MNTKPSSPNWAELWVIRLASENPRSVAARLHPESVTPVTRRLAEELPSATEQQWADWLVAFEKSYPNHFKPCVYRGDISKLTAAQKLAVANGETDPGPPSRKRT